MKLLVNALSIGSMSGQHVVYGFLRPLISWMLPDHDIVILHYENQPPPDDVLDSGVGTVAVSETHRHWARRLLWESMVLPQVIRHQKADVVLNVSGAIMPNCPVPQVTLCQNPWCYRPQAHYSTSHRLKAWLQRIGYRRAYRQADLMIYISRHLRSLYQQGNPETTERRSEIAWVALNEDTHMSAKAHAGIPREPFSILSVSAMARWKGAETLVAAVGRLREQGLPATLKLAGPWPESRYEQEIRDQIQQLELQDAVTILGKVTDDELHHLYATSQVFCLMSSCESFGIPAAEAMAFGTPIVSTDCCAIAEVCEGAGLFGPVQDPVWTADALDRMLTDNAQWDIWSQKAIERSTALTWKNCAQAFRKIPELAGVQLPALPNQERTEVVSR